MGDMVKIPSYINVLSPDERIKELKKIIDALLDLRLSLSIEKITKKTISEKRLRELIDDIIEKTKSAVVENELNKFAEEVVNYKKNKKITEVNENKSLSVEEMENIVNSKINFKEEGNAIRGTSLVKRDSHFNSSSSTDKAA